MLLATPVVMAGPAVGASPERIPFEDHFSFTAPGFCGEPSLTVAGSGVATGTTVIRRKPLEFYTDHVLLEQWYRANGVTLRSVERTITKDLKIVDNGSTLTIIVLATGNFTLYGPTGKAIARNPGQVRFRVVIVKPPARSSRSSRSRARPAAATTSARRPWRPSGTDRSRAAAPR